MKRRDVCWLCGGTLIWGADFAPQTTAMKEMV